MKRSEGKTSFSWTKQPQRLKRLQVSPWRDGVNRETPNSTRKSFFQNKSLFLSTHLSRLIPPERSVCFGYTGKAICRFLLVVKLTKNALVFFVFPCL